MTTFAGHDGLPLAYRTVGEGPYLVCHSGGPGRASAYLRDLAGLGAVRTLVLLDSRGTGESGRPAGTAALAWPHHVRDLEALREHLGVESYDLLGHSAGTVVAQAYAATHPDRVRRLVLVTPTARLQLDAPPDDVEEIVRSRTDVPEAVEAWLRDDDEGARPVLYGRWDDDIREHAYGADVEMDPVALASYYAGEHLAVDLGAITAPALVVAGSRDGATGVDSARAVAASIPGARLDVLDGIGHFPWVEAPGEFRDLVAGFLA